MGKFFGGKAVSCRAHLHLQTLVFVNVYVKKHFLCYKKREHTKLAKKQLCKKYFLQSWVPNFVTFRSLQNHGIKLVNVSV